MLQREDCAHACCAFDVLCRVLRCRALRLGVLQLERTDADRGLVADGKLHPGHLCDESMDVPGLIGALTHPLNDLVIKDSLRA
eukprot:2801900-Pleurochrysis_carterae.AAC.1